VVAERWRKEESGETASVSHWQMEQRRLRVRETVRCALQTVCGAATLFGRNTLARTKAKQAARFATLFLFCARPNQLVHSFRPFESRRPRAAPPRGTCAADCLWGFIGSLRAS